MQTLVSILVITYNSAETILETLHSIEAQTYDTLELVISDDCSADNTINICRLWCEQHRDRFVKIIILTSEKNTGVASNFNRAEAACRGEWVKPIAGDDVLMPNCIQDCVEYILEHSDTIYLFGRQKVFGAEEQYCQQVERNFDYSFFKLSSEEQLHRLIFGSNCVPATTNFYHRERVQQLGIKNDERIPLLEDWPRWINLLREGVKFHFVDKVLVKYRVGGFSTNRRANLKAYISDRLFCFYYKYPEWYKKDADSAVKRVVDEESDIYKMLIEAESEELAAIHQERNQYKEQYERCFAEYNRVIHSKAYRLGKMLLKPFKWLKK